MTREEIKSGLSALATQFPPFSEESKLILGAISALEQEPILDRDCEHCSKTYGTLGCCTTVSNKWVYSCKEGQREYLLDKIRAEIEALIEWHDCPIEYDNGNDAWYCEACNQALKIIDKYKAESEKE